MDQQVRVLEKELDDTKKLLDYYTKAAKEFISILDEKKKFVHPTPEINAAYRGYFLFSRCLEGKQPTPF